MRLRHANGGRLDAIYKLIKPEPVRLSDFTSMRREPTRPPEFRHDDFDAKFDDDTLFYDCVTLSPGKIVLFGPPFFNLKGILEKMAVTALPSLEPCLFRLREMDRHGQIVVDAPVGTVALELRIGEDLVTATLQPDHADAFAGRRVLLTQSRNNHLHWIKDWITFNRDLHGADAVLLYDNNSTRYGLDEILDAIAGIDGIATAHVVEWPFKFGPQGDGSGRFWDSDFCQHGVLEHARWRFLQKALSVQSSDIDELILSRDGRSVFEAAERSTFGVVAYRGRWAMGTERTQAPLHSENRSHRDYDIVLRPQWRRRLGIVRTDTAACPSKWTAVPAKCPPKSQWGIHSIHGWLPSRILSANFSYRHFREISDSWK